jgi:hypothetical protein
VTNAGKRIETTAGSIELDYGERRERMDDLRERLIDAITHAWDTQDLLPYMPTNRDCAILDVDVLMAEIAKTHRLVKLGTGTHGTYSRYTNGRCRCDLCREANRDRGRRYRKELKERENG